MKVTSNLIEEMELAVENQSLSSLYESQVDSNLFEDDCDYEKDARALFFDTVEKSFHFVDYITRHNPDTRTYESQNPVVFVAWVDANKAIASDLSELVGNLKEEALQNA